MGDRVRRRVQTVNDMPSCTIQSDAEQADIQRILQKFEAVGIVDHLRDVELQYGDISELTDYADATRQVKEAEEAFMKLPSKVREVFQHDVAVWLDSANDGLTEVQNVELVKLGVLAAPEVVEAPVEPVLEEPPAE